MQLTRKMSPRSVMEHKSINEHKSNEIRFADEERKDKLYEPKHKQKLVRVLTVVAYVIFVSMAAILLSLYYTFLWDPKDLSLKMRIRPECANVKQRSPVLPALPSTTSDDTQMEKIVMRPAAIVKDEELPNPEDATKKPLDLLTLLTQISTTENVSSTTSETTTSDGFQIDSLPVNQSTERSV